MRPTWLKLLKLLWLPALLGAAFYVGAYLLLTK